MVARLTIATLLCTLLWLWLEVRALAGEVGALRTHVIMLELGRLQAPAPSATLIPEVSR